MCLAALHKANFLTGNIECQGPWPNYKPLMDGTKEKGYSEEGLYFSEKPLI